ncbi:MAG: alanine racemase [Acidobacteria bacterium]|nr:alanine racemase [Acidobacteriota bacterium]MYE43015.1 alanine racemase [Acidobacteriota bacterium]
MKFSRRTVLRSALAPAALGWAANARAAAQTSVRHSSFDPWIEIRPDHVRHNVREVSRLVEGRPILAVIKNNAYGMGLLHMARILESEAGVIGMAVVKLSEALELREAGIVKPVLLMGPFDERDLEEAVMRDVTPMVYTEVGDALDRLAARRQAAVPVQVCVDTGMGRVGIPYRHAPGLIADLAGRDGVNLAGTMTTLNEDPEFEKLQLRRFRQVEDTLAAGGVAIGQRHAASSYGLFDNPPAYLDAVRPGMALFGQYSTQRFRELGLLDLRPSMSLKARVALVKHLREGDTAGYEAAYRAERNVWIATIPAGHVDGVPRVAAQGGWVRIGGTRYPIIASVSASHTIVEIGPEKTVEAGDVATYFDWRDGSRPEDASAASGASVYDLVMHLNPTLPRRLVS